MLDVVGVLVVAHSSNHHVSNGWTWTCAWVSVPLIENAFSSLALSLFLFLSLGRFYFYIFGGGVGDTQRRQRHRHRRGQWNVERKTIKMLQDISITPHHSDEFITYACTRHRVQINCLSMLVECSCVRCLRDSMWTCVRVCVERKVPSAISLFATARTVPVRHTYYANIWIFDGYVMTTTKLNKNEQYRQLQWQHRAKT